MRTLAAFSLTTLALLLMGITTVGALPIRSTSLHETSWAASAAGPTSGTDGDIPLCC
ncbi:MULTISPECIES: hypothetical protein [unclassified Streptomyces]|uniref:hypothetical protein n=1 Tax=unclassified Streptomyces TaxID=2593676 RepID=UPI003412CE30